MSLTSTRAQADTEVFVVKLINTPEKIPGGIPENISKNPGYDNQPSFYNNEMVLFSSTRNGQTDIAAYNLKYNTSTWKTDTPGGGEYSPLRIPDGADFSAIRLDTDGTQLLYAYSWETGESRVLLENLKVGYHVWYGPGILVSSVLVEDRMDLVVSRLSDHSNYTFQKNVGRSLHKIPGTRLVSYISKENKTWELKSIDPISGATKTIVKLPSGVEDVCWLNGSTVLAGMNNKILRYSPDKDEDWILFKEFPADEISNITRLACNVDADLLLMVAEIPGNKTDNR